MNFSSLKYFQAVCPCDQTGFRSNINLNSACRQKEEHVLGRTCCTNWQDTFIQTNMDVIARWVRVITLAKGRHFLNLLVLHRFRVSSESYKLAPRIDWDKGTMGHNACPMIPVLHSVIVSPARQQAMSSQTRSDRRDILSQRRRQRLFSL